MNYKELYPHYQYLGTGWVPQQSPALAARQAQADQNVAPHSDKE